MLTEAELRQNERMTAYNLQLLRATLGYCAHPAFGPVIAPVEQDHEPPVAVAYKKLEGMERMPGELETSDDPPRSRYRGIRIVQGSSKPRRGRADTEA